MLVDTYDTACFTKSVQCHARKIPVILIITNHYDQENPLYLIQSTYSKTTSVMTMTVIALEVHSLCQHCKPEIQGQKLFRRKSLLPTYYEINSLNVLDRINRYPRFYRSTN